MREPCSFRRINDSPHLLSNRFIGEGFVPSDFAIKFYRILTTRYRSPFGEIDIVAARGDVLAIVEVRALGTHAAALEAISPHQRQRLQDAAMDFWRITLNLTAIPFVLISYWRRLTPCPTT